MAKAVSFPDHNRYNRGRLTEVCVPANSVAYVVQMSLLVVLAERLQASRMWLSVMIVSYMFTLQIKLRNCKSMLT